MKFPRSPTATATALVVALCLPIAGLFLRHASDPLETARTTETTETTGTTRSALADRSGEDAPAALGAPDSHHPGATPAANPAESAAGPYPTPEPPALAWLRHIPHPPRAEVEAEVEAEVDFTAFLAWATTHLEAGDQGATAATSRLEARGLELARRRRDDLIDLIQTQPERALQLALPETVRASLPPAIADLVERTVDGRGDLEVLCALPEPGQEARIQPLQRFVVLAEERYQAFVHGQRLGEPTRRGIPLHGIVLGGLMAVAAEEQPSAFDPLPTAAALLESSGASVPAASTAGLASVSPSATTGTKRLVFIRVDFSDLPGESFSSNRAVQLTRDLDRFYRENSFDRSGFHEIGQGSAVTPVLRLSRTAASYGSAEDSSGLRSAARAAARAAGYTLSAYDYDLICFGSVSGFGWAGLAYIGAPGAWIRGTSSTGVVAHELGHNFGLGHANFWDTGGESTLGSGQSIEYGDKFDTMGAANAGNYHFNARYKRLLGWLQPGEFTVATSNGTYRIHAQDQTNAVAGSRGLQVFTNPRTNFWLEFRQRFTSIPWLMDGAGLRWAGRGSEPSLLLDTTPGSAREKDDAAIVIGRTFSDSAAGIHLTPIAKGGSNPAWLDIVVQRGPFPDNRPPVASLAAPATRGTTATTFEFAVEATDPDGDLLAYAWDFGDGSIPPNRATSSHRWTSAGDYLVQCTVSDTRGGTARSWVAVAVGSPTTLRIGGRVTRDGEHLSGAQVSAGSGRTVFTDAEGAYLLVGLPRGSYSLTATVDGTRLEPVGFTNPLDLTTSRADLDFVSVDTTRTRSVTLVPAGAFWLYWDRQAAPATGWLRTGFDASGWDEGAAILGYGGDRETTVLSYGPESSRKYATAWFRREFVVENPGALQNLRLEILRDDGALVHLNGREVVRENLPAGTITAASLASSTVGGAAEVTYFAHSLDSAHLVAGTNVLAVEIHQASLSSSDLAFDLRLLADVTQQLMPGIHLTRPSPGELFTAPARIVLAAAGDLGGADLDHVEFLANGQPLGRATGAPFTLVWSEVGAGELVLQARAVLRDGATVDSASAQVTVRDPELTPTLIARRSLWRYLDDVTTPPETWREADFDDTPWAEGPARLGYGEDGEFTVVSFGPDPARKRAATWFRRSFTATDVGTITNLISRLQCDDGAAVYLNGRELFRSNLRTGILTPTLYATLEIDGEAEQAFTERTVSLESLREGRNCIAVEVHRSGSMLAADLGFDFELVARRSGLPAAPRLGVRLEGNQLFLRWPARYAAWRVETSPDLGPGATWTPAEGVPRLVDSDLEQTVPLSGDRHFHRVAAP